LLCSTHMHQPILFAYVMPILGEDIGIQDAKQEKV